MSGNTVYSFIAFACILPATFAAFGGRSERNAVFWATLIVAVVGPIVWLVIRSEGGWHSDFASTLWITVACTLACYGAVSILTRQGWQLAPIIMPYMALLALIATIWDNAGALPQETPFNSNPWVLFHVLVSVITYAVVTTGACAALAGYLRERSLKNKQPTSFTQKLPSMADCDTLQLKLLSFAELVLGLGLITGMAASLNKDGFLLHFDHKTVLAVLAFVVIGVLLIAQRKSGVRGQQVTRLILAAYLLLTLAYPGVKFVTDVLLSS